MPIGDRNKSDLPPELLDRIFSHCERNHRRNYMYGPNLLPKSRLQPLLLVCKKWHNVAERRLYASVSVGSDRVVRDRNGSKMEITGKDVCRRFYETVQSNARIASIVRELRMGSIRLDREESEMHVYLIGICKNVEKIELRVCHETLLDDLAAALAKADLISLHLSREQPDLYSGRDGQLFSLSTVIRLLQSWPRLETIYANLSRHDYGPLRKTSLGKLPPAPGACPALRTIDIFGDTFHSAELSELGDIAPRLEEISATVHHDCDEVLQQCVKSWSSSLKRIVIFTPLYSKPFPGDACPAISSPMVELRELHMPSPLFTPSAAKFLPKLEKLHFRGEYSHGMELARLIEKGEMPCLREIDTSYVGPIAEDGMHRRDEEMDVEIAKELRRVCRERRIFAQDMFTEVEELEEHYGYPEESPESSDNDWCEDENFSVPAEIDFEGEHSFYYSFGALFNEEKRRTLVAKSDTAMDDYPGLSCSTSTARMHLYHAVVGPSTNQSFNCY